MIDVTTPSHPAIDHIEALFERQGAAFYGEEPISQLQHALQCALLAEQAHEKPAQIVAALLHDVGHLLIEESMSEDRRHQEVGEAVTEPIRLHVAAKRYLCVIDDTYFDSLSPASQRTLMLQGGVFDAEEATRFSSQPWAGEAVRLRQYDDLAKVQGLVTPDFAYFRQYFERVSA